MANVLLQKKKKKFIAGLQRCQMQSRRAFFYSYFVQVQVTRKYITLMMGGRWRFGVSNKPPSELCVVACLLERPTLPMPLPNVHCLVYIRMHIRIQTTASIVQA